MSYRLILLTSVSAVALLTAPRRGQDIAFATRAVFFWTEFAEYPYATDGGTLFLVQFRGKIYGLTCDHVLTGFDGDHLFVTQERLAVKDSKSAPIKHTAHNRPSGNAIGTDIDDVCVIEFSDDMPSDFFKETPYRINDATVGTSKKGHVLRVIGFLKEKSSIVMPNIVMGHCSLEYQDDGIRSSDPFLRQGVAQFENPEFSSVTGISGSPVFNVTSGRLCGMVNRGGMVGNKSTISFIDIFDITKMLEAVHSGASHISYSKTLNH